MSSDARQVAIAILPKFSGFLSVLGSGFIIYDILCSHFDIPLTFWKKNDDASSGVGRGALKSNNSNTSSRVRSSRRVVRKTLHNSAYYRLMLAMSTSDFVVSFAWFCTTWPIPKDENVIDTPSDIVYGNVGTQQACTVQGFFIQLGIITPFYNAILALYYYLTIRCEWKEKDFKCKVEYAGHFVSISWGLGTSIAGLVMELFNNSRVWCWIAPYPSGCGGEDGPECVRGINATQLRWVFYYGPLWVMIFLVALFMSLVYAYVKGLDNKMDKYTSPYQNNASNRATPARSSGATSSTEMGAKPVKRNLMKRTFSFSAKSADALEQKRQRRNERSKAVANQGLFYASTFALVWVFGTIVRAMQLANKPAPWALVFLFAVFTPSQGFFNFLVYVRPRLIKYFEERKKLKARRRPSKASNTPSSFSAELIRVSGVSINSSSNDVMATINNLNQELEGEISDPYISAPCEDTSERGQKVRFAGDGDTRDTSERGQKVRFCADDKPETNGEEGEPADKGESADSEVNDNNDEEETKSEEAAETKSEEADDPNLPATVVTIGSAEKDEISSPKENGDGDVKTFSSFSADEVKEEVVSPTVKEKVVLFNNNATIDLATGEVRTRKASRRKLLQP